MGIKDTIGIGEFRQRATEIIREVEETARPVVIARRGRPVVEIRAIAFEPESLIGSVSVRLESMPVDHRIAVLATLLPGEPPTDPADRIIIATALHHGGAVVTPDQRIHDYAFCPAIW